MLLSGADYPIKPRSRVRAVLADPDKEYIRVWNRVDPGHPECRFVSERHALTRPFANPRSQSHNRADQMILRLLWRQGQRLLPRRGTTVGGIRLFQGSQWWALTRDCVQYLLDFHERHPRFYRFFRLAAGSDEIFFHSILMHSPFSERIYPDPSHGRSNTVPHGIHYIDWQGRSRGVWSPRTLDESDFPAIEKSDAIFARKFDESVSARLLDRLDERNAETISRRPAPEREQRYPIRRTG